MLVFRETSRDFFRPLEHILTSYREQHREKKDKAFFMGKKSKLYIMK